MINRHAYRWMVLILLTAAGAICPVDAETPVASSMAQSLAPTQISESTQLAGFLVMFIPWSEVTPTPPIPTNQGAGNGNNNGGGTGPTAGGGTGQSTGGGNGKGSGSSPGSGGSPGGDGGSTSLGGGITHDNPEPASLVTTLVGAALLGLAGLRRRRWSLG